MMQCEDCEFFRRRADGTPELTCDPYSNIKEPECIAKLQLAQLVTMTRSHEATLDMHRRLAPLQERMMRHVERELDENEEADRWKYIADDDDSDDDDDDVDDDSFPI